MDVLLTRIASVYDLAVQVYDSFGPDLAEGVHLDLLCSIIGIIREPATYTVGICQLTGVALTVVPAGTQLRVPDGPIVETDTNVTLTGGADDAACTAIEIGEIDILINTVTEIVTPVVGLNAVDNAAAFTSGRDLETDAELRVRRERSLVAPSSSTDYGIGSALTQLTDVDYARAVSDRVLHTVRCLVYPNTADTDGVAVTIWDTTPAGIELIGVQSATVTDAAGNSQTVYWDWVTEVAIVVVVTIGGIPNTAANTTAIKLAITDRAEDFDVGEDVYAIQLIAAVVEAMGEDVTSCLLTVDALAVVIIDLDEVGTIAPGDITVNYV
jgi:uncharacterized phage protein gp47/JayE